MGSRLGHRAYGTIEGLTELQKRFTERIVSGESPTLAAAYRAVYGKKAETPAARRGQSNNASKLWRHTGVQLYAERQRRDLQAKRNRRLAGEQDRLRDRLWREATPKGIPVHSDTPSVLGIGEKGSDRIAALRLLAQSVGMFSDSHVNEPELSPAELIAEISAALAQPSEQPALDVTHECGVVVHESGAERMPLGLLSGAEADGSRQLLARAGTEGQ